MNKEQLIKKYQASSDEMLRSMKEDNLNRDEFLEWYGYMRAVRDCAFEAGILSETTIYENLQKGLGLLTDYLHDNQASLLPTTKELSSKE